MPTDRSPSAVAIVSSEAVMRHQRRRKAGRVKFAKRCAAVSAAVTAAVLFSAGGAQEHATDQARPGDTATRAPKSAEGGK